MSHPDGDRAARRSLADGDLSEAELDALRTLERRYALLGPHPPQKVVEALGLFQLGVVG